MPSSHSSRFFEYWTWPADGLAFLRLPYDHLVHSQELTTVDRYPGPSLGVEHLPIVVTLAMAS